MSTYTLRPVAAMQAMGGVTPNVISTFMTNISDGTDATTVYNNGGLAVTWIFNLGTPSIPATEFPARIGTNIRWKGNTNGNYSIGGQVYRQSDGTPSGVATITPNNSSAFTTTQVALQSVNWGRTSLGSLYYKWVDNRTNASWPQTDTADVWGSVYTLALATATPQAKTESSSVFPTLAVDTTATIDWEATTQDWQNLRKVTVEVRVESGGTGAGTGTLITSTSTSVMFTATGTQTVNVTVTDPIPNGTYKIYSRALRYREDGLVYADAYGAWSSAATLTMSAPLPLAPTVTVAPNDSSDTVLVSVTPNSSTGYLGPYIYLQRSDDLGNTWTDVRTASGVAGTYGTASSFIDYEAPRDQTVLYRARITATYSSSFINTGTWSSSVSAYLTATSWNIKHLTNPAVSAIDVNVVAAPTEKIDEDLGVFRPLGRRYPVVVGGTISGWDGELSVVTSTSAEWAGLKALAESQAILLLESAFGWSKYVRLLPGTSADMLGTRTSPRRTVKMAYVEVAKPAVVVGEAAPTVIIPTLVDGGASNAAGVFADSVDGGTAVTAYLAVASGGNASGA